jgi:hypothetical protein
MDSDLRQSMFRYYDERAPEYEEAYLLGTGTASIRDPGVFQAEALLLEHVVERFGHGRIIDVACGTGYSALIGFLFSHLTVEQERLLFTRLEALLDDEGEFLILDSAWSPLRAQFNAKVEHQERQLNDATWLRICPRCTNSVSSR